MIIKPLRPQSPKPVTLLIPGYKTLAAFTPDGMRRAEGRQRCYNLLKELESHVLYVGGSVKPLLYCTGATAWTGDVWRGRATTLHLYGTTARVTSLRRCFEGIPVDFAYDGLCEVVEALADQGVRAGSISSMAWALWRASLSEPVELASPPKIGRAALYGGRQESVAPTKFDEPFTQVDLKGAYRWSMAERAYAGVLREVSKDTCLDPNVAGLAQASVYTPSDLDHPFACLPKRVAPEMIQWQWGATTGVWPWVELVAAADLGCEVVVERCWAPLTTLDLFSKWYAVLGEIEARCPTGVRLLKSIANSLWGVFALNGDDRGTVTWRDEQGYEPEVVPGARRKLPHARSAHIAAETTARVRVRMLREALYGGTGSPVHIDTDGYLIRSCEADAIATSSGVPGEWSRKTEMRVLEVRGPQLYRYLCGEGCGILHPKWHVVASGIPHNQAHEFFEKTEGRLHLGMTGFDVVLPSGHPLNIEQVRRYRNLVDTQRSMAFGEVLA
jgi:hypothetical protein